MALNEKFGLLRNILKTLGLSAEATDDIVDRISNFLSEKIAESRPPCIPLSSARRFCLQSRTQLLHDPEIHRARKRGGAGQGFPG